MVQNQSKGLQKKATSSRKQTSSTTKKGKRTIAPKKADAVKHSTLHKSLSAKINKSIERQIVGAADGSKLRIVKPDASQAEGSKGKAKTTK